MEMVLVYWTESGHGKISPIIVDESTRRIMFHLIEVPTKLSPAHQSSQFFSIKEQRKHH